MPTVCGSSLQWTLRRWAFSMFNFTKSFLFFKKNNIKKLKPCNLTGGKYTFYTCNMLSSHCVVILKEEYWVPFNWNTIHEWGLRDRILLGEKKCMLMTQCGECGNSKEQPREKEKTTVVSMTCRKPQKKLWHSIQTYSLTSSVDEVKGLLLRASFLSFVCGLNSFSAAVITLIPPHLPPSTFVKATLVLEPSLQRHE